MAERSGRSGATWIVVVGLVFSLAGLGFAVAAHVRDEPGILAEPKSLSDEAIDTAVKLVDKLRKKKEPRVELNPLRAAAAVLGFLGVVAGVIGWIRREDHRLCGAAAVVGVLAIGWQWILAGLMVGVVMLFVGLLVS